MPAVASEVSSVVGDFNAGLKLFKTQLKEAFSSLDLTTVAAILLVIAGAILLYDLLVIFLASSSSRRSFMLTPTLAGLVSKAWDMKDDLALDNFIEYRSLQTAYPVLEAISQAMKKYEQHQE